MKDIYTALADKNRRKITNLLINKDMSVSALLKYFSIKQSTLSAHLAYLLAVKLVNVKKENRLRIYSVDKEVLMNFKESIDKLFEFDLDNNKNGDIADIGGMLRR